MSGMIPGLQKKYVEFIHSGAQLALLAVGVLADFHELRIGSLSLLAGGMGFGWAWIDRDRLAWHDRASGTRMRRAPKR